MGNSRLRKANTVYTKKLARFQGKLATHSFLLATWAFLHYNTYTKIILKYSACNRQNWRKHPLANTI